MRKLRSVFIAVFLLLFANLNLASAQEEFFAPEEIIVKFTGGASAEQIGRLNQKFSLRIKQPLDLPRTFILTVPKGLEDKLSKIYGSMPIVEYAEPNYIAKALLIPNDPYFSNQWGLTKIQSPQAWDLTTGSSTIKIAIVDTGIDNNHPDLASKTVVRKNFTSTRSDDDINGHGTHVAGIAAAITNNNLGVAGTGFNSTLMSVKVLNDSGSGYYSWITNGIKWAADNGAKVINLSLGGGSSSKTLEDAVNYAWSKGVILACAAGNDGTSSALYPAYYQNCLATAATDSNDQKTSWSNYGSWVDVAAPGLDIFSTLPNHKAKITNTYNYGSLSGTSMATPFVSGLAGLLFGQDATLSNSQVRSRIEETADKIAGTGSYWIKGRINAYQAVLGVQPLISLTPTPTVNGEPTLTPTPLLILTSTPTPIPPTPTNTPIPTSTPTPKPPTPTPNQSLTPTPTPWYCRYFPNLCQ